MKFRIKTLSPVHIGCGESYTGLTYLVNDKWLDWFDVDDLFNRIGPEKLDAYVKWLDRETERIATLKNDLDRFKRSFARPNEIQRKELERLKGEKRDAENSLNLKRFCQTNSLNTEALRQSSCYRLPCRAKLYDSGEVSKFISQQNQPYIPGTEIKGAIRTAVLYCWCRDVDYQYLKTAIEELASRHAMELRSVRENQYKPDRRTKDRLNDATKKLASRIEAHFLNSPGRTDPKYDIMKSLFVSDSDIGKPEDVLSVAHTTLFNPHRRLSYGEYCMPEFEFSFHDISIDPCSGTKQEKLGFSQTQQETMSDIKKLFGCCHDFTNDIMDEEISYFQEHGKAKIVEHLKQVKNQNTPDSPVLRIGKDQGYFSLTLGLLVKKNDPELYEQVLIHTTKGKSYDSDHGGPLPKSRKIVHYDGKELTSGWIKLIPEQSGHTPVVGHEQSKEPKPGQPKTKEPLASPASLQALHQKWSKR